MSGRCFFYTHKNLTKKVCLALVLRPIFVSLLNANIYPMTKQEFQKFVRDQKSRPEAAGEIQSSGNVNAWLMSMYQSITGQTVFRTFKEWKALGFRVKKGSSSFPVFSRPSTLLKAEKGLSVGEDEQAYFFTCHLFHAGQVEPMTCDQEAAADCMDFRASRTDTACE